MRKGILFMSMLTTLLFAGCSQEEITPNGGENNGSGETTTSYLAVNLVSSGNSTRAAEDYEDGDTDENHVSSVRFYFFNGAGAATNVKLKGNQYVNYYDWTPGKDDQKNDVDGDSPNYIESILQATLVINTASGDRIPQRMAAILNPSTTTLGEGSKSLEQLKEIYRDYADAELTKNGTFVMYNAVYADRGAAYSTALIKSENLCTKQSDALDNPVTIKVERNVAKVRVKLDSKIGFDGNNRLALKDKDKNPILVNGKQVYLKLNGWDLTAEAKQTRLIKKINPGWGGGTWWDGGDRTFWAINAPNPTTGGSNSYYDYSEIKNPFNTAADKKGLYTNENAEDNLSSSPIKRTKVIISGTLCDEAGAPFTIVRHLGAYYADTFDDKDESKNLKVLKTSILGQLVAKELNYYYETDHESKARTPITEDDLKITYAEQISSEDSKKNCYVYAQLTEAAEGKTWYDSDEQSAEPIDKDVINNKLKDKDVVGWPLVWAAGQTYYFYEIKHTIKTSTETASQPGVVRNHIYDTNITKIAGLGTPVYNPGLPIYPEIPDPNDHYIAAEIKILSWHVVSDDYELVW